MRARFVVLSALAASAWSGASFGQSAAPDPAKLQAAADAFDAGSTHFQQRDYEAAAASFEAADRAAPSAAALVNAIKARKLAKQPARAATLAAWGSARFPSDKAIAAIAKDIIAEADKTLHRAAVSCSPGCSLVLDGKILVVDPVKDFVVYVSPGAHSLVAAWSGDRSKTQAIDAKKAGHDSFALVAPEPVAPPVVAPPVVDKPPEKAPETTEPTKPEVKPEPPPEDAPPPPKTGLPIWVPIVGLGVTAGLGGATIWSGIDTQKNPGPNAVRSACAGKPDSCAPYQEGLRKEKRTDILIAGTSAAGAITIVLAIFTKWSGNDTPQVGSLGPLRSITPVADVRSGGTMGFGGVF